MTEMSPTRARIILAAVAQWDKVLATVREYNRAYMEPPSDTEAVEAASELALAWIGVEVALRLSDGVSSEEET